MGSITDQQGTGICPGAGFSISHDPEAAQWRQGFVQHTQACTHTHGGSLS